MPTNRTVNVPDDLVNTFLYENFTQKDITDIASNVSNKIDRAQAFYSTVWGLIENPDSARLAGANTANLCPEYVMLLVAQACLECDWFAHALYRVQHNPFGIYRTTKRPDFQTGQVRQTGEPVAYYKSVIHGILCRLNWDEWHDIHFTSPNEYIKEVTRTGYAGSQSYGVSWLKIYNQIATQTGVIDTVDNVTADDLGDNPNTSGKGFGFGIAGAVIAGLILYFITKK